MTPFPARLALLAGAAAVVLALAGTGTAAAAELGGSPFLGAPPREDGSTLLSARDRSASADAIVGGLKRALSPGHLVDPLPAGGSTPGLDALRTEYSDMQRRAAGYRATLGDRHPTLASATLVLAELKVEIAEETRRVLAGAERDAAQAHAALDLEERRAMVRDRPLKDATGSIGAAVPSPVAPSAVLQPAGSGASARDEPVEGARVQDEQAQDEQAQADQSQADQTQAAPAPGEASASGSLAGRAAASGGILLAITAALWGAVSRARRLPGAAPRPAAPRHRREPDWTMPAAAVRRASPEPVPQPATLRAAPSPVATPPAPMFEPAEATLPVAGRGTPRDVAAAMAQAPGGGLAQDAARLVDTLEAAHGGAGRMTVLVVRAEGVAIDQGDGVALALAIAGAARGRRVALLEARPAGRLRRSTVPAGTAPMVIAAGGTARTAYRFAGGGAVVVVLPGDAGEAEAAAAAARRDDTLRLDGLDGFDLVVMVGERAAALSRAADLVLVVAGPDSAEEAVAAAAKPCRAMGRICRTITLRPAPVASGQPALQADPDRTAGPSPAFAATDAAAPPALRGTFGVEPERLVA